MEMSTKDQMTISTMEAAGTMRNMEKFRDLMFHLLLLLICWFGAMGRVLGISYEKLMGGKFMMVNIFYKRLINKI